jgi:hypothetical protein
MKGFVDDLWAKVVAFRARGWEPVGFLMSEEGEKVVNAAFLKERAMPEVQFGRTVTIHGVPIVTHKNMKAGQVWFVLQGGKK